MAFATGVSNLDPDEFGSKAPLLFSSSRFRKQPLAAAIIRPKRPIVQGIRATAFAGVPLCG